MTVRNFATAKDIIRFEGTDRVGYWRRFSMLLGLAVTIATMGLVRDSGAVIIAAMLVAPLMTPILGIAAAIVTGWIGRAFRLIFIVWLAALASVLIAWLIVWLSDFPRGVILPHEVLSRTDPGAEDLVIALAAGIAGAYVQIQRSELSLLPGAAIGVSLVPPLATAGILLYFSEYQQAYEAVLLFATNFGAIILSACGVYLATGGARVLMSSSKRRLRFSVGLSLAVIFLFGIMAQLFSTTYLRYTETRAESALAAGIAEWAGDVSVEIIRVDVDAAAKHAEIWGIVDLKSDAQYQVAAAADLLPEQLTRTRFRDVAREILGPEYSMTIRYQLRYGWEVQLSTFEIGPADRIGPFNGN
ncbi:DUF389 domain-containing protein [Pseudooceanicola nanhaiensis]|uniref:DUF389 domain-containing protein n=1 Tax=Pseudooceanicola nanhaiensis TaxID=375761 RepID=UPI001CD63B19|nr:DUF389 domain-containing protein [Pseudooceanicola nanhaiensis]MCA0922588.1 DUF389 domain-containing protein [Pseudooceanicola nanhaiensis]